MREDNFKDFREETGRGVELEIDEWGEEDFSDIILASRPESKHEKMKLEQRAKQFMPFEAVKEGA